MQFLTIAMIIAVSVGTYLTVLGIAPNQVRFAPEILSILAAGYVIAAGPRDRFRFMPARYWIAFVATGLVIICGVMAHAVAPGPLIGGIRFYLRAIPFFFLPAVYRYTDQQLERQLKVLLAISLLQLPISAYQRLLIMVAHKWSGDPVVGTMVISSIMSIFLIGSICISAGLMLRQRLSIPVFFALFVLFIIPTTINETKATLFLLPIGLTMTLVFGSAPGKRLRIGMSAIVLIAVFGAIFVPVYNHFSTIDNPYPFTLSEFFGNPQMVENSVNLGRGVGTRTEVGRGDALIVPLREFSTSPMELLIGTGIGNASRSSVGSKAPGAYYQVFGRYAETSSAGTFLLEIGLLGSALVFWLYWLIFRDAVFVAAHDVGIKGSIALGWVGVTAVMAVATFYKQTLGFESLSYLFWYFSGLIAGAAMQVTGSASSIRGKVAQAPPEARSRPNRSAGRRSAKARALARPGKSGNRV
jgi:hypothetical protein